MPFGICTIESKESLPCKCLLATGTPKTGNVVLAATIPGKCAAPPAPAIITWMPFAAAVSANSNIKSGVRCAETTCASYGTPKSANICAANFMVGQSLSDPIMMATFGDVLVMVAPVHKSKSYKRIRLSR